MDITNPIFHVLAYELAIIFAVLSIWLVLKIRKRNKKANEAASKAVKRLKRTRESRIELLSKIMAERYGLESEALSQTATEIQEREQQLYKLLFKVFVEQDSKSLVAFPTALEKTINECLTFTPMETTQISNEPVDIEAAINLGVVDKKMSEMNSKLDTLISGVAISSFDNVNNLGVAVELENANLEEDNVDIIPGDSDVTLDNFEDDFEIVLSDDDDALPLNNNEGDSVEHTLPEIDVGIPNQDEGIDLSSFDEDFDIKKSEAELGETTPNSVAYEQRESGEHEVFEGDNKVDDILVFADGSEASSEESIEIESKIDSLVSKESGSEESTLDKVTKDDELELADIERLSFSSNNTLNERINENETDFISEGNKKEIIEEVPPEEDNNIEFGTIIELNNLGAGESDIMIEAEAPSEETMGEISVNPASNIDSLLAFTKEDDNEGLIFEENEVAELVIAIDGAETQSIDNKMTGPVYGREADSELEDGESVTKLEDIHLSTEEEQLTILMAELTKNINTDSLNEDLTHDDEKLNELLSDVGGVESEESFQDEVRAIMEQVTELEPESHFLGGKNILSDTVTKLTDEKLPFYSEDNAEDKRVKIKISEEKTASFGEEKWDEDEIARGKLKSILSEIPSFLSVNK